MSDEKTIAALKTNFLRQQIRILSQPLKLSDKSKKRIDLPEADLRDVLMKVNQTLRRHNSSVYDRVAVSNVASQIEQLIWYASGPDDLLAGDGEGDDGVLRVGDDLTEDENIQKLSSAVDEDEQTDDYIAAVSQLQKLSERRQALQRKLDQYRKLRELVEPLKDAKGNVQPNLVAKDGELAAELAKTKILGMRVAAGLARRNERGEGVMDDDDDDDMLLVDERKKLAAVLGR